MNFIGTLLPAATFTAIVIMWSIASVRHRSHLGQCAQDLNRHHKLSRRLSGCINDLEVNLRAAAPGPRGMVPEEMVGIAQTLFGLRQEARDNSTALRRHSSRLRWPDGYLGRMTLAGRRCEMAHQDLADAFDHLAEASREYECGLAEALEALDDTALARPPASPVRCLSEEAAVVVARHRVVCDLAVLRAADACRLEVRSSMVLEADWPVRQSELLSEGADFYRGDVRPLSWGGLGGIPLVHADAR